MKHRSILFNTYKFAEIKLIARIEIFLQINLHPTATSNFLTQRNATSASQFY